MTKTVYIVGAGASTEFGDMPVGRGLALAIQGQVQTELAHRGYGESSPIIEALRRTTGYGPREQGALERIVASITTKDSIDDFVSEWRDEPGLADIAKFCIASEIIKGERLTTLFDAVTLPNTFGQVVESLRGSWIDWIVRHTNRSIPRRRLPEALADTSFITFNYDRCIEFYLYHYMMISLGMGAKEAREAVGAIAIEHVYGAAGQLPELGGGVSFGNVEIHELPTAAARIRTYTESIDAGDADRIRSLVAAAHRLVFLGCAFHPQNLDLLFGPGGSPDGEVWATTFRLRNRQVSDAQAVFSPRAKLVNMQDMKAGEFLDFLQDELF